MEKEERSRAGESETSGEVREKTVREKNRKLAQ